MTSFHAHTRTQMGTCARATRPHTHARAQRCNQNRNTNDEYQLKGAWITQKDLFTVYVSVVRSVLEYACPVLHTNLPRYLSDSVEMMQKVALKCIFQLN